MSERESRPRGRDGIDLDGWIAEIVAESLSGAWASSEDPDGVWRRRGSTAQIERTITDLDRARDDTRRLLEGSPWDDGNEFAIGAAENRVDYVVGDTGLKYEAVAAPGVAEDVGLIREAQAFIDAFAELNDLAAMEAETVWRLDRDGDCFVRLFAGDGIPEVEFVAPERVYPPADAADRLARAGERWGGCADRGWGVIHDALNRRKVRGYWTDEGDGNPVAVSAAEMCHLKLNTSSEWPRGWPTFEPARRSLIRAEELLVAMAATCKARAKIALITEIPGWTAAKAENLVGRLTSKWQDQPNGEPPKQESTEDLPYGAHIRVREGTKVTLPSTQLGAADTVEAIQSLLRTAASRVRMPEWMFSGLADQKYSNAFVVEAPSLKMFKGLQRRVVQFWGTGRMGARASVVWRAMRMAARGGLLNPAALRAVQIKVTAPSLESRDKSAEASANATYIDKGVKPVALVQQELGYDPAELKKLEEKFPAAPPAPDPNAAPPLARAGEIPPAEPTAEALSRLVSQWLAEGGAAASGGTFRDHFGVSDDGERWVCEELISYIGEAAKKGKVLKEIEVKMKSGKTYKKKVWVNAEEAKAAAQKAKADAKDEAKANKLNAKAESYTAAKEALKNPGKADPIKMAEHLSQLSKADLLALKQEAGFKGGTTKDQLLAKFVATVKAKGEEATAAAPKKEAKPKADPKPAAATAQAAKKADAQKAVADAFAKPAEADPVAVADHLKNLTKPEVIALAKEHGAYGATNPKKTKEKINAAFVQAVKDKKHNAEVLAKQFAGDKVAGGKPTTHFASIDPDDGFGTPSPAFKKDHPYASAQALGDFAASGRPNSALPDDTRPAVKDEATAKYINNYTWGYDGPMNKALRDTGAPPPGPFGGGTKTILDMDAKPNVDGPKMYAALRKQFAAAKSFAPPPVDVYRGIDVDNATRDKIAAAAIKAHESGGTIKLAGFQSTSTNPKGAFEGNIQYKIKAIHGLDVQPYSHFGNEKELLLNHNCEFKVTKVVKNGYDYELHLEQVTTGN